MKTNLLSLIAIFIVAIGYSQTFTDNFISYTVTSATTVEVADYDDVNGSPTVVIPASVSYNSTNYSVTSIKFLAFQNSTITSVDIPDSVTIIGVGAFSGSTLNTVSIGDSVVTIEGSAFLNCSLTNVTIPDSVTSIGNYAFQNNSLVNLFLGNSVATIGNWAFTSNQLTALTIPNSVTTIGDFTFQGNPLACIISEATVPPAITTSTTSGMDTFNTNRSNIDLSIPTGTASTYAAETWTGFNSVTEGLAGTFTIDNITYQINPTPNNEVTVIDYNTAGGTVVNIPAMVSSACTSFSVTTIGDYAFQNKGLTSVTLPDSVLIIRENGFFNNSIATVTIPDSVTQISDGAFANNSLTSVVIGNNVTSIGEYAFRFNSIASLTIPDSVLNIEELAFDSNVITNLDLGNGVQTIGNLAFRFNPGLQSVTIPASVTSIGEGAFATPTLTEVIALGATPPSIITSGTTTDTFSTDRSNIHLYIPSGTMGAYVTNSGALWTGFNPVTEGALGISDFELDNDIKVVSTLNQIEIKHSESIQLQGFNIYGMSGAKVMEGNKNTFTTEVLSKGIYIIELNFDKGRMAKKFVK
ncbi:leucine-rich repeat domain-containing protein [Tamlana crocina]